MSSESRHSTSQEVRLGFPYGGGNTCLIISRQRATQTYGTLCVPLLCQRICNWWSHCSLFSSSCKRGWLITWIISDCDKLKWASSPRDPAGSLTPRRQPSTVFKWAVFTRRVNRQLRDFTMFCSVFGKYSIITLWYICERIKISCLISPLKKADLWSGPLICTGLNSIF